MEIKRINGLILCWFILLCTTLNSGRIRAQNQTSRQTPTSIDVSRLHYLTSQEKDRMSKNGFVVFVPKRSFYYPEDEALSIYSKCKSSHFPVFVTSDVILHVSHLLFDWSLRFLEISNLRQDLLNLTNTMLTQSLSYYDQIHSSNDTLKEAALKNAVFFNISKCLLAESSLEDVPQNIKETIQAELSLIDEHAGFFVSPLFGYKEDYGQYVPRGHYSRSPEFERYFKAMMWYGRMGFRLAPIAEVNGAYILDKKVGAKEMLQAILICKALDETKIKGESVLTVWKRIYETTSFFAGKSDDITVEEYKAVMDKVYGENCSLGALADDKKLTEFVKESRQLRKPKILSTYVTDISSQATDWKTQTQGLRLMGQRFTPDSHIFQNLVYDKVKWYTGKDTKPFTAVFANGAWFRGLPRGLDIMSVFGCQIAEQILDEERDGHFQGYKEQLSQLKKQYSFADRDIWTRDLYWSRIWALKSILDKPHKIGRAHV